MLTPKILDGAAVKRSDILSNAELRAEADHDLARRSLIGIFSYFVVWLIIYYASELENTNDGLLAFLGFMLAAAGVARLYLVLNFRKVHAANPGLWRWLFAAGTIISAGIWGGVGALAIDYDGLGTTAVMVMLPTAAIAAGGIVSLAPAPRLGAVFLALLLVPSMTVAWWGGSSAEKGVALLFLTFLVVLTLMWRRLHLEYWGALAVRSELMRAKEEAEAATQAKGQFIASVSHELRTPLTSVIGALGLITQYPPDGMPNEAMALVDMAYRNGKRLSVLINDILDFEKLDAHQMKFHVQPLEVSEFLKHVIDLNDIYSDRYRVTFVLDPPPPGLRIMADENRLTQVVTNLLSNAAKHSPPKEQVVVSAGTRGEMVRVSVSDHGAGIPDDFKPRIFEKFAQAEHSNTGKAAGTGLGLAISKAIIEQMGGTIGFESVVGQGTTFYFDLPVAPRSGASGEPHTTVPRRN